MSTFNQVETVKSKAYMLSRHSGDLTRWQQHVYGHCYGYIPLAFHFCRDHCTTGTIARQTLKDDCLYVAEQMHILLRNLGIEVYTYRYTT
jgi:hypothetical protein